MSSRKSSVLWYHFNRMEAHRAKCVYCGAVISTAGGSLGNLKRHLKTKHPTVPLQRTPPSSISDNPETSRSRSPSLSVSEPMPSLTESDLSPESVGEPHIKPHKSRPSQASLRDYIEVVRPISVNRSKTIDLQLLRMVCKEYHPISLVDDPEFIKFVGMLCPGYKLPSRKTLSKSLLPQLYFDLVGQVKAKLADSSAVALTTHSWTSINTQSFIAITAHYVNSDSVLCSSLLSCYEYTQRHTSFNLSAIIRSECEEWNIGSKLMAIVTDNAPNITAAASDVSKHIPCYAHTLNLIVKSGISPINGIIEKCKAIVRYFKTSSIALTKLHEIQLQMNLTKLKLIQDVPTRWNSTYEMLKRLIINKNPILSALALLQYSEVTLIASEWDIIESIINILEVFDDVTKELSASKNVTLSKAMVLTRNLYDFVLEQTKSSDFPDKLKEVSEKLLKDINERLIAKEHDFVPESALLDPRFKKSVFKNSSKFQNIYERIVGKIQSMINKEQIATPTLRQAQIPSLQCASSTSKIWEKFDRETISLTAKQNPKASAIVEMDKYLAEPLLPRVSDPLIWWEQRKLIYPHLYTISMQRLCIPASSVPCERIFSKAGQIMTERRSRLLTSKLSKILFIQNNV